MKDNNIFPNAIVYEKMFHYIWTSSDMFENTLRINLPQTVIFKNSLPIFWYFTNKMGQIKKRKPEGLSNENIYDFFTRKETKSGVVAQLLYPSTCENEFNPRTNINPKGQIHGLHYIDSSTEVKIRYLTSDDLAKFLNGELQISSGVLQQFIEPATLHNDTIQVVYTPRVVIMNKRVNTKNLYNSNVDIYERCCTFDGPDYFSSNVQMSGPISKEMTEQVDRIMSHLETISFGLLNILKIHLYFKIDSNRKIWFLWSGGVQLHDQADKSNQSKYNQVVPEPEIQIPDIHQSVSIKRKPLQLQKELYCLKCNTKGRSVDFFELKFGDILNEFDKGELSQTTQHQSQQQQEQEQNHKGQKQSLKMRNNPYNQNKVFGKSQRDEQLGESIANTFMMEYKRAKSANTTNKNCNNSNNSNAINNNISNNMNSSNNNKTSIQNDQRQTVYKNKQIPQFFTLLFPKIDADNFSQISNTIYFKNQKVMVCRECYLEYCSLYQKQLPQFNSTMYTQDNITLSTTNTSQSIHSNTIIQKSNRSISLLKFTHNINPQEKKINLEYQKKLRSLSEDKLKSNEKIQRLFKMAKRGKVEEYLDHSTSIRLNTTQTEHEVEEYLDKNNKTNQNNKSNDQSMDKMIKDIEQQQPIYSPYHNVSSQSTTLNNIQKQSQATIQETLKLINEIYSHKNNITLNSKINSSSRPSTQYSKKYNKSIDPIKLKSKLSSAIGDDNPNFFKKVVKEQDKLNNDGGGDQKLNDNNINVQENMTNTQKFEKNLAKIIPTNPFKFSYYEIIKKEEEIKKNKQNKEEEERRLQEQKIKNRLSQKFNKEQDKKQSTQNQEDIEPNKPNISRLKRSYTQINFIQNNTSKINNNNNNSNSSSSKRLLKTSQSTTIQLPKNMNRVSERFSEHSKELN